VAGVRVVVVLELAAEVRVAEAMGAVLGWVTVLLLVEKAVVRAWIWSRSWAISLLALAGLD
jgi:hypothetical protein